MTDPTRPDPSFSGHRALPIVDRGGDAGELGADLGGAGDTMGGAPGAGGSILERKVELGELLDIKSFREVCASFVELYKIGIKIFDVHGTKLVDVRVGNGDWCGYIFANGEGRSMCTGLVGKIKSHPYPALNDGQVVEQDCFSGLRYLIMPINYGGDLLGRVVYGPFVPEELARPGDAVFQFGDGFDPDRLWTYTDKIRRANDRTIRKIIVNFRQVIDTIVAIAFRALMTQHLHLESITTSYHELAESNRTLRHALDRQKELDRMKTSFLAMLSHELRTPLTSIIGYSEMMLEGMVGPMPGEQRDFVSTIREKGEALLDLISSLLQISKVESGVLGLEVQHCDVRDVLTASQRSVIPAAQKKSLRLEFAVAPDVGPILADRDKIVQCVTNLLSNAIKFTPHGGRIECRAGWFDGERRYSGEAGGRFGGVRERFMRIDVSDTGIGIAPDKIQQVFRAFYQVDNSFTREYGGVGLGLAIVKSFVDAHGGEVWVTSHEGQGTTFSLLLPPKAERQAHVDMPSVPSTSSP